MAKMDVMLIHLVLIDTEVPSQLTLEKTLNKYWTETTIQEDKDGELNKNLSQKMHSTPTQIASLEQDKLPIQCTIEMAAELQASPN
jgi:hypothetical protein